MKEKRASAVPMCALAAVSAGIIFVLTLLFGGFAPFGEKIIVCNDALYQYVPMLTDFAETVREGGSLLYSFHTGGANFYGEMLYYLVNPFNLVALLFSAAHMTDAFTLIVGLCTAATAASTAWYLQKRFACRDISTVVFALLYTFSGFYIAYHYNTMWLMALMLLPLIARGIEKLTSGEKPWLYLFSLAFAIICNFYLGFMLCIFAVLYFFVCLFSRDINKSGEDDVRLFPVLCKFGGSSLAAGGLSAVTLMPIVFALSDAFTKNAFIDENWYFFNFLDFFTAHLPGVVYDTIAMTGETLPAVALGGLVLVLMPLYAFLKSVSKNERIAHIVLVLVFWASFEIPTIYYIWHGMSAPAGLPYRFSFLYCFVLVVLAYQVYRHLAELSPKWLILTAVALGGVLVYAFCTMQEADKKQLLIALVLVCAAFVLVLLTRLLQKGKAPQVMRALALVLVVAESTAVCSMTFLGAEKSDYAPYAEDVAEAKAQIETTETGFYRMDFSDTGAMVRSAPYGMGMTGRLYQYNGISDFSSLADSYYSLLQFDMGNPGNLANTYGYAQQTPMYNTLFGLDYVLDTKSTLSRSPYYTAVGETANGTLYKTEGALGLGILANPEIAEWDGYNNNSLAAQSSLWQAATGASGAFNLLPVAEIDCQNCAVTELPTGSTHEDAEEEAHEHEESEAHAHITAEIATQILTQTAGFYPYKLTANAYSMTFTIVPEKTQSIFLMSQSGQLDTLTVTIGDFTETYTFTEKKLTDLGLCEAGVPIQITFTSSNATAYDDIGNSDSGVDDSLYFVAAGLDDSVYQAGLQTLQENGTFTMTDFSDTDIKGTITAAKDCVMTMAMPYDEGWTVTLDGEEIELIEHSSHWMMFAVPAGEHELEMHYFPQGLKEGLFVSAATILVLLLVLLLTKMRTARFAAEDAAQADAVSAAEQNALSNTAEAQSPVENGENPPTLTE
ncbi:MAG: YfhO family protein [Candidatus Fimenecus sp.]